ncbi:MAG: MMPL family transporter [Polyangia bacterium]
MKNTDSLRPPAPWIVRYARFLHARTTAVILICLALTGIAVGLSSRLTISTEWYAVLPRGYPSVEDLHKLMARIGSTASLTVGVESPDREANQKFADAFVVALQKEMGPQIANVDYKVDALTRFYRKHAAVYLPEKDLLAIDEDLKAGITEKKLAASPVPYDLDLDDEPPAAAKKGGLGDITRRLDEAQGDLKRFVNGYYASPDGKLIAIFIRPRASGADAKVARAFVEHVRQVGESLHPASFNPAMKFSFTGAYYVGLDEQDAVKRDLVSTAGLCIGLIGVAVTIYFRRIRVIALLGATLVCGCAWAFGLAAVAVGYLNIQTAFLGSIIMGTGINYGVILLARYLEERRRGAEPEDSLARALGGTWLATLTAAGTTAVSFGTLLIAQISSFRHFAIIGGGGILFCWLLSFTLLPALLVMSERLSPTVRHTGGGAHWPSFLVELPLKFPRTVLVIALAFSAVSVVVFVRFLPDALETDSRNLRNKEHGETSTARLDKRVADIRKQSMTPAFVVTDSLEEAKEVCAKMDDWVAREGEAKAPIKTCRSIYSMLPKDAAKKLVIAHRIADRIDALPVDALSPEDRKTVDELRSEIVFEDVQLKDLPEELVRPFREVSGEVGRLVAIYPPNGRDLAVQEYLFAFTDAIRRIDLGHGRVVTSSGDAVIFSDILRMITHDAPRTTALAFVCVILFVFLALRGGRSTAHVTGALVIGVLWMVGIASMDKVKINFFNFVALPTTFGIAVDYTINLYTRFHDAKVSDDAEGRLSRLRIALRETGGAIFLCSVTTIIGYGTLIIADNRALVSFGKLAILGEVTCVIAALILLPATLLLDKKS